jgi:predicted transcriptional regulator
MKPIQQLDPGISNLLDLHGQVLDQGDGYWIKIEAWRVVVSAHIPHGVRYTLTLHEPYGKRILGYDNAHAVKPPKRFKFAGHRLAYDHKHRPRVEGDQNTMKAIVVGIMSQERMRERMLSIAKGEYKPKPSEPKIWFTSMRSLAEVLSDENRTLLKVIRESQPESISSLANMTGRQPGNLSRTLKTMSNYGFVEMKRENKFLRPIAKATEFRIVA